MQCFVTKIPIATGTKNNMHGAIMCFPHLRLPRALHLNFAKYMQCSGVACMPMHALLLWGVPLLGLVLLIVVLHTWLDDNVVACLHAMLCRPTVLSISNGHSKQRPSSACTE